MGVFKKWWSVLFVVPLICIAVFATMDQIAFPLLTYEQFHIQLSALGAIKLIAVTLTLVIPYLVYKIYKVGIAVPFLLWILLTGIALITDNGNYESNPNYELNIHIFFYQFFAILGTMGFAIFRIRSRTLQQEINA